MATGSEPIVVSDSEGAAGHRVETILGGWWKRGEDKFRRCRTMDLGIEEGVIVLDAPLREGDEFELHLDIEAEWSVKLQARVLSSRAIFFGKQHLTKVCYKFPKISDRSMFGLWLQKQLADQSVGGKAYLKPVARNPERRGEEPELAPGRRLTFIEDRWRRALATLIAHIPWREAAPVPDDRRSEHRGQVGLSLTLLGKEYRLPAEMLNVSWSGACIFLETARVGRGAWPSPGDAAELVVPDSSLLMGSRRCPVELVWSEEARIADGEQQHGRAYGLKFRSKGPEFKRTFMGDLLRRLRYDPRQVRKELRFPLNLPVRVTSGELVLEGRTLDLGAGGARLLLPSPVKTPSNGFLDLTLPASGSIKAQQIRLSLRFLRELAGPESGLSYAVAFRQAQPDAHLKLSRWLATRMRVQTLPELMPELGPPLPQSVASPDSEGEAPPEVTAFEFEDRDDDGFYSDDDEDDPVASDDDERWQR